MSSGRRRVSHPILRLQVLGPDGRRQTALRVYCRERRAAVPLGTCSSCIQCEKIVTGPFPTVECTICEPRSDRDPRGTATPVAAILAGESFAVERDTMLRDAIAHLREDNHRAVPVIDHERVVVGVIYETHRWQIGSLPVSCVMGARLTVPMETPVRRALELMAAARLREVIVVDDDHVALGTLRDVDALHWIAMAARGHEASR